VDIATNSRILLDFAISPNTEFARYTVRTPQSEAIFNDFVLSKKTKFPRHTWTRRIPAASRGKQACDNTIKKKGMGLVFGKILESRGEVDHAALRFVLLRGSQMSWSSLHEHTTRVVYDSFP
jgi:hypothetical protein